MLMKDLNMKLNHILLATKTKKSNPFLAGKSKVGSNIAGFSNLDQMGPLKVR